jgi:transporter family-2 protein
MNKLTWIVLTLLAGALLPIQAGLNAKLGKAAASPSYAALISFLVGTLGLIIYILVTGQTLSWTGLKNAPVYTWFGGLLGAFYITVMVLAFPQLGPGLTFGLIVAGQMLVSVLLDHYNVLVSQPNPVSYMRILGVLLVVTGVIIIRKY